MKKNIWWILSIAFIIIVLFSFGGGMMAGGFNSRNDYGMMGGYDGMMGNWGYFPFGWLGMGIGMLVMWGIPIGIIAIIVFGIVSLRKSGGNSSTTPAQSACPQCAKDVQSDWRNCPYCGTALK